MAKSNKPCVSTLSDRTLFLKENDAAPGQFSALAGSQRE
jgi:hypothetical protein